MNRKIIRIYLCGSIKKGEDDNSKSYYWGSKEESEIIRYFGSNWDVRLLNPATVGIKRGDSLGNFGGDLYLVSNSNFIFVDARDRRGIGIGGEMVIAKLYSIPVVTLCPPNSYYRKKNVKNLCGEDLEDWVHPFITGLSDFVADSILNAINWMMEHIETPKVVKNIKIVQEAIEYFSKTQTISI